MIMRKDAYGTWVNCYGEPLDPQPVDPEPEEASVGSGDSESVGQPEPWEQPEDGSIELVLNYDETAETKVAACDISTCTVLRSLAAEERSLQEQLKAMREKQLAAHAQRKKERKKRFKAEAKQLRHVRREQMMHGRWEKEAGRAHDLAVQNVQLAAENERLIRAILGRSIGFNMETPRAEMDHVLDALTWWCIKSGDDVEHRVDYWEMWGFHDSISEEIQGIVKEYDADGRRHRRR